MSETSKRVLANEYIPGDSVRLAHEVQALEQERADLRAMGEKVNAIRNSIVGCQGFNFSEHAYPLVAALNAAGFVGEHYPEAKANVGTLIEQRDAALSRASELEGKLAEAEARCSALARSDIQSAALARLRQEEIVGLHAKHDLYRATGYAIDASDGRGPWAKFWPGKLLLLVTWGLGCAAGYCAKR